MSPSSNRNRCPCSMLLERFQGQGRALLLLHLRTPVRTPRKPSSTAMTLRKAAWPNAVRTGRRPVFAPSPPHLYRVLSHGWLGTSPMIRRRHGRRPSIRSWANRAAAPCASTASLWLACSKAGWKRRSRALLKLQLMSSRRASESKSS